MPKVIFKDYNISIDVAIGETIYDAARRARIDLGGFCGGRGLCGKCKVKVFGNVSKVTEIEQKILGNEAGAVRLACQTKALGNVEVLMVYRGFLKTSILGYEPSITLNPAVRSIRIVLERPTLNNYFSTVEALYKALGYKVKISLSALRKLADRLKEIEVIIYDYGDIKEILDICSKGPLYGLAIDVGTTKIAMYVVNLLNGETIIAESIENPQIVYGADVVSRISYAMEHDTEELHRAVIESINRFLEEISRSRNVELDKIYDVVFVGNSVMHHLFLGINPLKIGIAPYEEVIRESYMIKARDLGLKVSKEAYIYAPPLVGGFIGSDSLVGAYILGLGLKKGIYMFLDIGTNTEVYLAKNDTIYVTSTASGPAFEGGHIKYGMKAIEGAIEKVIIDEETLEPEISVIGNVKPRGITGSGIIDAIAEMLKAGIINYTGRFKIKEHPRIRRGHEGYEYILVFKNESGIGEDIVITQKDVREIQRAKAAIQAAYRILSRRLRIKREDLEKIYIAGSFGFYLRPENAIVIGLLPEIPLDRIELVGNTAGSGARSLLKNKELRKDIEKMVERINYIELALDKEFHKIFADSMYFPSRKLEDYPMTIKKIWRAFEKKR